MGAATGILQDEGHQAQLCCVKELDGQVMQLGRRERQLQNPESREDLNGVTGSGRVGCKLNGKPNRIVRY